MKKTYSNAKIEVTFDSDVCEHAAKCVSGSPLVFDPNAKPWVNVDGEDAEKIAATIKRCPSGALSYKMLTNEGETTVSTTGETTVTVVENGPLRLAGNILITDEKGEVTRKEKASLCRCGNSANKPFCDGTHKTIGWKS